MTTVTTSARRDGRHKGWWEGGSTGERGSGEGTPAIYGSNQAGVEKRIQRLLERSPTRRRACASMCGLPSTPTTVAPRDSSHSA